MRYTHHTAAPFELLDTDELLDMSEPDWLVDGFIAEKSTTMIYGPWGLGKSFMVLDMVLTASTGSPWHGGIKVNKHLKTLYVVAEGASWWPRRVKAFEIGRGLYDPRNLLWYPKPVDLVNEGSGDIASLEMTLEKHKPDVIVFDTWVRCTSAFGMNENDAGAIAMVYNRLDYFRDEYNVSPVIVHHPRKNDGEFRGSGNQAASLEVVISLRPIKDSLDFTVHSEKGNHMEPWDPFRLSFHGVPVGKDKHGEEITSAYLDYEGSVTRVGAAGYLSEYDKARGFVTSVMSRPMVRAEIVKSLPTIGTAFEKVFARLVAEGLLVKEGSPRAYTWRKP